MLAKNIGWIHFPSFFPGRSSCVGCLSSFFLISFPKIAAVIGVMAFILVRLAGLLPYDSIDSRWWGLLGVSWEGASLLYPISLASGLEVVLFSIVLVFVFLCCLNLLFLGRRRKLVRSFSSIFFPGVNAKVFFFFEVLPANLTCERSISLNLRYFIVSTRVLFYGVFACFLYIFLVFFRSNYYFHSHSPPFLKKKKV